MTPRDAGRGRPAAPAPDHSPGAFFRPAGTVRRILVCHHLKPWRHHLWLYPKKPRDAAFYATVSELIDRIGLSQPLVSWHLGRLRVAGLIQTRRVGRETVSRLLPEAFHAFPEHERRILGIRAEPEQARS